MLLVLENIKPPDLRRKIALEREFGRINENVDVHIHEDILGKEEYQKNLMDENGRFKQLLTSRRLKYMQCSDVQLVNSGLVDDPNEA